MLTGLGWVGIVEAWRGKVLLILAIRQFFAEALLLQTARRWSSFWARHGIARHKAKVPSSVTTRAGAKYSGTQSELEPGTNASPSKPPVGWTHQRPPPPIPSKEQGLALCGVRRGRRPTPRACISMPKTATQECGAVIQTVSSPRISSRSFFLRVIGVSKQNTAAASLGCRHSTVTPSPMWHRVQPGTKYRTSASVVWSVARRYWTG
ncbi:hypothetical protein QC763_0068100 [Podospora pseudopauciseta]|uniref:Secreted protein n=1 Tax=Podospora pseudopauciseta TaxID=2093780 RepID=A0ABR0HDL7_9PEZI|nr:hypothetical protein QC763_0068100 [Podospora pseudopauciseta]